MINPFKGSSYRIHPSVIVDGEWTVTLNIDTFFQYMLDLDENQTEYNPETNPTLFNEFTTAALRYGHSTITG